MPQVHHSVREGHLRAGRRTLFRDEGTRRGETTFGAAGSRAGRSPKGLISAGSRAPCGLGCRGPEIPRGIDASARRSQSHSRCTILPKFLRVCQFAAGEGCKTSCRSCRVGAHQSTRCGTVVRKTSGAPRCHRVWDKESILALTDLMHKGVRQCLNLPSTVNNMVV